MTTTHAPTRSSLQLTRRGRALLVLVLAALVLTAFSMGRASSGTAVAADGPGTTQVVVQAGDTLWGLAAQVAPQSDPRQVVDAITRLNGLTGELQAGQVLLLPVAA